MKECTGETCVTCFRHRTGEASSLTSTLNLYHLKVAPLYPQFNKNKMSLEYNFKSLFEIQVQNMSAA